MFSSVWQSPLCINVRSSTATFSKNQTIAKPLETSVSSPFLCNSSYRSIIYQFPCLLTRPDADAVIKCFATAVSTGILLCLSPILFGTELSFLALPGTAMVFIASWLYMEAAPPKETVVPQQQTSTDNNAKLSKWQILIKFVHVYQKSALALLTGLTILICAFMTMSDSLIPNTTSTTKTHSNSPGILDSPFKNTLALIRWNSERPERMPLLEKYRPFFHDLHFSMPNYLKDKNFPKGFNNLTHDSADDSPHIYIDIAKTMQLLMNAAPGSKDAEIDGLFYFHFDAWIAPLDYASEDFDQIWFPDVPDLPNLGGGPRFECMQDSKKYPWWGFVRNNFHEQAMAAATIVEQHAGRFIVNTKEWCVGWSDIYYIPKKYFPDYIFLANVFGVFQVFHEVAVPTIVHIIDQSRRAHPSRSIMKRFGDCWGDCCSENPDVRDILSHRCGHRLDYRQNDIVSAHYDRLDKDADMLGDKVGEPDFPLS